MLYPLMILIAATCAAAVTVFGADPAWAAHRHGLEFIMLSRRLQWPLVAFTLTACLAICALVIAGRWRAWWLIGLLPILGLFVERYAMDPMRMRQVAFEAKFVAASEAKFVAGGDEIVGLTFDGEFYAYPYSELYEFPVVAQAKPRRRLVVIWSAYANRAVAAETDWSVRPRELEIVSEPANALLVYNNHIGQFINGVTGLTPDGQRPSGFLANIETVKTTWASWKRMHPATLVLSPPEGWVVGGPTRPIAPRYPIPGADKGGEQMVALIQSPTSPSHPVLVKDVDVSTAADGVGLRPLNLVSDGNPLLVFREADGMLKAFLRQANGDLTPRFYPVVATGKTPGVLTEQDSNSGWANDGRAISGPLKGEKLQPFVVDDLVYLSVIKYWYPNATILTPTAADVGELPRPVLVSPRKATRSRGRRAPASRPRQPRGAVAVRTAF